MADELSHLSIEDLLNAQADIIRLDVDRLLTVKPNETFVPNDGALNTIRAEARRRDATAHQWPTGDGGENEMSAPITADELKNTLAKHVAWLTDDADGERANLWGADLRDVNLRGADLRRANLMDANLWGADLMGADLWDADLRGANLRRANLMDANLWGADLRGANLMDADLRGANLMDVNLRGANLILAGQDVRGYLFCASANEAGVVLIRAGCREFVGIAAARQHWTQRHTDDAVLHADCLSLVDRIEAMAAVRGWKLEPEEGDDGQ